MPAPTPQPPTPRRTPWPLLAAAILGLALLATYANSFRVPFLFDDDSSIAENLTLRSWRTVFAPPGDSGVTVSGRPLLNATLAFNYAFSGKNIFGYHATNLIIHFLAALTLFGLTRRSLRLPSLREKFDTHADLLALAVSALWALHPLQTESVTYIVQRAESLVGLFYLLVLYCFVRSIDTPASARRWKITAFFSCVAGMASKEVMVSAPLIVLLFDRTFVSGSFAQALRSRRLFHLALASTWLLLAFCIFSTGNRGGTVGANETIGTWSYFLTQCQAIPHYLRLVVWPHPLVLDYGSNVVSGFQEVAGRFVLLLVIGLATLVALWKRPALGFLGTVFFAVLAPTSSFVPVLTQTMAEHRMYLALAPLVLGIVLVLHRASHRAGIVCALLLAVAAGAVAFNRNHDYRDLFTLWENTRDRAPLNSRPLNNLGGLYVKQNDYPRALGFFNRAAEVSPDDLGARIGIASCLGELGRPEEAISILQRVIAIKPDLHDAYYNLGKILAAQNDFSGAIAQFTRAIEIKPSSVDAHYNLGNALLADRRPADAADHFRQALVMDPAAIDARNNLGNALVASGHLDEAIREYRVVLEKSPGQPRALLNLGRALSMLGHADEGFRYFEQAAAAGPDIPETRANLAIALLGQSRPAEAIPHFEAALRLGLNDPTLRLNYGNALLSTGRGEDALVQYRAVVSAAPSFIEARTRLAVTLLHAGRPDEAVPHYEALIKLTPDSHDAYNNLGIAYAQLGRMREARACFEYAVRLKPDFTQARENLERASR
ncbi:MAG: tetratricopeptide repeat protein [Nibricoccus sp.]